MRRGRDSLLIVGAMLLAALIIASLAGCGGSSGSSPPRAADAMVVTRAATQPAKPIDYSGRVVKAGTTLDLGGKMIKIAKPITVWGKITNGTIDGTALAKFDGCIYIPKGSNGASIDKITVLAGSYNGLAKVWGNEAKITSCTVLPGTGWAIQILGADRCRISRLKTKDLRRGGIYIGDGTGYGTHLEPLDCIIEDCILDGADEESPCRTNTAQNLIIRRCFIDNTRCRVGKEALQLRGRSGTVSNCTILGSIAGGQQQNGVNQSSKFTITDTFIFGYSQLMAGADFTYLRCGFVTNKTTVFKEKTYTLMTAGNGAAINPQKAERGLPDAVATVRESTIAGRVLTDAPKRVTQSNVSVLK